jgi:Lytic polysaccharide mono-oxygenase, cellulose-degrading
MTTDVRRTQAPHSLRASAAYRADGGETLHGLQLEWTVGANSGGDWPPPDDWNDGSAPYPHHYEIWVDGAIAQTADIYWPGWAPGWQLARSHWLCLGTDPAPEYQVQIRARLGDGTWSPLTPRAAFTTRSPRPYRDVAPAMPQEARTQPGPRHGSVGNPPSRVVLAVKDNSAAPMCARARTLITSTTWQEVIPPPERMIASPPWNGSYLEYRKFFSGTNVPSASNPAFAGLDLRDEPGLGWPATRLSGSAGELTFTYIHTAHHVDATWTHQWFITRDGWTPEDGVSWASLEPTPFLTETHGDHHVTSWTTAALARKAGRHAIVDIWGGHGGPELPGGGLAGEFFLSCCDVVLG